MSGAADLAERRPTPEVGARVGLRHPVNGVSDGVVTRIGDCGYPRCGAGDRCVTISVATDRGPVSVNRTPTDLEPHP